MAITICQYLLQSSQSSLLFSQMEMERKCSEVLPQIYIPPSSLTDSSVLCT